MDLSLLSANVLSNLLFMPVSRPGARRHLGIKVMPPELRC